MRGNEKSSDTNRVIDVPRFGVAGFPPNFFASALKKNRENIFQWLEELDLDWIELQCTRGVKMKAEQAHLYRNLAANHGIGMSIHGPYFISLASGDPDVVARSRDRLIQCFELATQLQTDRIIFHPGYFPGETADDRRLAVNQIVQELNKLKHDVPSGVHVYPETAGKNSQIGSLDEIIEICERVDYAKPCIDLAHIHAFEHGCLWNAHDISDVFLQINNRLGDSYLDHKIKQNFHDQMIQIEYCLYNNFLNQIILLNIYFHFLL